MKLDIVLKNKMERYSKLGYEVMVNHEFDEVTICFRTKSGYGIYHTVRLHTFYKIEIDDLIIAKFNRRITEEL